MGERRTETYGRFQKGAAAFHLLVKLRLPLLTMSIQRRKLCRTYVPALSLHPRWRKEVACEVQIEVLEGR